MTSAPAPTPTRRPSSPANPTPPPTPWPPAAPPQALAFAQHLSGANLALSPFFGLLGLIFTVFVCYVTYSYVMVACAAFLNAFLAMIHGYPRRRARRRITQFLKHAALVFAYVTYISIAALIVLRMATRGGYADQVGMTHPVARLFMMALISAVAIACSGGSNTNWPTTPEKNSPTSPPSSAAVNPRGSR
jgi:hypothetical protein